MSAVIDNETSPETSNYRKHQRDVWAQSQQRHDNYLLGLLFGRAVLHGAGEAAGRDARGEALLRDAPILPAASPHLWVLPG